jgi:hypothetical protein
MLSLFGIYSLRDIGELAGITLSIYLFLCWLRRDEKSPLVLYSIGIFTTIYMTHLLQLPVLTHFLLLCVPWFILMLILFHQKMLQSNYIAYDKKMIQKIDTSTWIQVMIRALVRSMNSHQRLTLIIERTQSVSAYINCEARMNATLNDDIVTLIFEAHRNKKTLMMLLDDSGSIKAVPVSWDTHDVTNEPSDHLHDALLVTAHNDTLVITTDIHQRTFNLIMKGVVTQQLSAAQLLGHLEQILVTTSNWRSKHDVSSIINK